MALSRAHSYPDDKVDDSPLVYGLRHYLHEFPWDTYNPRDVWNRKAPDYKGVYSQIIGGEEIPVVEITPCSRYQEIVKILLQDVPMRFLVWNFRTEKDIHYSQNVQYGPRRFWVQNGIAYYVSEDCGLASYGIEGGWDERGRWINSEYEYLARETL